MGRGAGQTYEMLAICRTLARAGIADLDLGVGDSGAVLLGGSRRADDQ
jgi:hypothetical protein